MTATLRELIVRISADSSVYQREMNRATRMGSDYYKSMESGARRAQAAMRRQQESLRQFNTQLQVVQRQALATGATIAAALAADQVVHLADGWNSVNARLKQASTSADDFRRNQAAIFALSQRTGTQYQDNANLFAKSAASMREFGFTSTDVLKVTEALAVGLQVSGATAEDSSSVIRQFTQALAQGVLRGEEFNAVNESGDRVVRALAAGMGVARKDLKAFADSGQLTIDKVVPALISQLGQMRKEFEDLPASVERSGTRVANAFQSWLGGKNGATGSTTALASGLDEVAEHMDAVASAGLTLIAAGVAKYLTNLGTSAVGAAKDILQTKAAELALADAQALAAQRANQNAITQQRTAKLELEQAQARVASIQAGIAATREAQAAEVARMRTVQQSLAAERALESQRLQAQITDKGRQLSLARLAEIRNAEITLTHQVATAEQQLGATTVATSKTIEAAYAERAAAAGRFAKATKAANAASVASERATAAAAGTARLASAGGAVLSLLGGPAGLVALAAAAATSWLLFGDAADDAKDKLIDISTPLDETVKKFQDLSEAQRTLQLIEWGKQQQEQAEQAADAFSDLLTQMRYGRQDLAADNGGVLPLDTAANYDAYVEQLKAAQKSGKSLIPVLTRMKAEFDLPDAMLERWVKLAASIDNHNQKLEALAQRERDAKGAIDEANASLDNQGTHLNKATLAASKYLGKLQEKLAKVEDPTALAAAQRYLAGLQEVDPAVAQNILTTAKALDDQTAAAKRAKEQEQARTKAIKDAARAAEQLQQKYRDSVHQLDMQIKLSGSATELDRMQLELQDGKLSKLSDEKKRILENKAAQLDQLNALGAYQDMMSGVLTDEERLTVLTKERLKTLDRARPGISDDQFSQSRKRVLMKSVSDAPDYQGVDPSVAGAGGELVRAAEADKKLADWRKDELQRQKDFLGEKLVSEQEYNQNVLAIEQKTAQERQSIQRGYVTAALGLTSQMTGDIADMLSQMGDESSTAYKVMFAISKAASLAQGAVNVEEAYTKALALDPSSSLAGWVRGLGYASLGIMAGTSIAGMAHDGIDTIPSDGTWLLQKGERVVDSRTNSDLKRYLQSSAAQQASGRGDVYVDIDIHQDGSSKVAAPQGMEAMGRELKQVVDRHIGDRLAREQRPGGVLYQARRGN